MTESEAGDRGEKGASWTRNLFLFLATIVSVFSTYAFAIGDGHSLSERLSKGGQFAASLLTILVAHELGHWIAARIHKVDASLPFFIPLPILSPFGTMGAVIRMRGVIPTRRALLDIGASGPLAGLVFAIPLYIWGIKHSQVIDLSAGATTLGNSIALTVLDKAFAPPITASQDIMLSPIAYGAWGGMFVTMINLLPVGQLDGGHVAYSLFGPKQDAYARFVHRAMLAFFFVAVAGHVLRDMRSGLGLTYLGKHVANSIFWLFWFELLAVLGQLSTASDEEPAAGTLSVRARIAATVGLVVVAALGRDHRSPLLPITFFLGLGALLFMEAKGGVLQKHALFDHPPTANAPLDKGRAVVAVVTLAIFVLLFMPEPFSF